MLCTQTVSKGQEVEAGGNGGKEAGQGRASREANWFLFAWATRYYNGLGK